MPRHNYSDVIWILEEKKICCIKIKSIIKQNLKDFQENQLKGTNFQIQPLYETDDIDLKSSMSRNPHEHKTKQIQ